MNKKTLLFYLILFFEIITLPSYSLTLRDKFLHQTDPHTLEGCYIVTHYHKNFTFLRFHSTFDESIILEEITIPAELFKKTKLSWEAWISKNAPFSTSWIFYKINTKTGKLLSCYSFSKESFLTLEDSTFLPNLFVQQLYLVESKDRKKIGPAPKDEEQDTRKLWNPVKIYEGVKHPKNAFSMYEATWPEDCSELSSKKVHLYFDQVNKIFPFPYWLEVGDGFNSLKMPVIDSGQCRVFPHKSMPKLPPLLTDIVYSLSGSLRIDLKNAQDFLSFQLIATAHDGVEYQSSILPYERTLSEDKVILRVSNDLLLKHLKVGKNYHLTIIVVDDPSLTAESQHPFHFKG